MFGFLGIPLLGGFVGFHAMFLCLLVPKLKRFAVAAFVVPLVASIVWWVGVWILICTDEHCYSATLSATPLTSVVSAFVVVVGRFGLRS